MEKGQFILSNTLFSKLFFVISIGSRKEQDRIRGGGKRGECPSSNILFNKPRIKGKLPFGDCKLLESVLRQVSKPVRVIICTRI